MNKRSLTLRIAVMFSLLSLSCNVVNSLLGASTETTKTPAPETPLVQDATAETTIPSAPPSLSATERPWPDTTSTDGFATSRSVPGVVDLPNILSKLLNFSDMSLSEVVATATVNAAKVFPFLRDKGTLNVGADADVAVLELREGEFEFLDNYEGVRVGRYRLYPVETIFDLRTVGRTN